MFVDRQHYVTVKVLSFNSRREEMAPSCCEGEIDREERFCGGTTAGSGLAGLPLTDFRWRLLWLHWLVYVVWATVKFTGLNYWLYFVLLCLCNERGSGDRLRLCVCVCARTCGVCECVGGWVFVWMCVCLCVCECAGVSVCECVCVNVCACVCVCVWERERERHCVCLCECVCNSVGWKEKKRVLFESQYWVGCLPCLAFTVDFYLEILHNVSQCLLTVSKYIVHLHISVEIIEFRLHVKW